MTTLKDITLDGFVDYIEEKRRPLGRQLIKEGKDSESYEEHKFLFKVLGEVYSFKNTIESKNQI